jgi:hypothetical protein
MPRKAPDKVIEHRISLSNFERQRIDEMITSYQAKSAVNSVANVMGAVSLPMLGVAALIWVGFSIDDAIDEIKSWTKRAGNKVADWLTSAGLINYTADEIGRAITATDEEKVQVYEESIAFYNEHPDNYSSAKGKAYRRQLTDLESRDVILRKMLNDIATGNTSGMYKAGWVFQQMGNEQDKENTADLLQNWYEYEGGPGDIDWEISDPETEI